MEHAKDNKAQERVAAQPERYTSAPDPEDFETGDEITVVETRLCRTPLRCASRHVGTSAHTRPRRARRSRTQTGLVPPGSAPRGALSGRRRHRVR